MFKSPLIRRWSSACLGAIDEMAFLSPILSPDWGALVGMLPIFLLIGVVGPLLSVLVLGWFIYVVRRPRSRSPLRAPATLPARLI